MNWSIWLPIIFSGIATAAAVATTATTLRPPRHRLSWRTHLDNRVGLTPNQELAGLAELTVRVRQPDGSSAPMTDASVVLLRVRNDGRRDIRAADFTEPLTFRFPGRKVVGIQVKDGDDALLTALLGSRSGGRVRTHQAGEDVLTFSTEDHFLRLPRMHLARGAGFRMLVLLDGQDKGVVASGLLDNGDIVADRTRLGTPGRDTRIALFTGTGAALLALVVAIVAVSQPSSVAVAGARCVPGPLAVSGSTAFAPATTDIATRYHQACPDTTVTVNASGQSTSSFGGVRDLDSTGRTEPGARTSRLADSDGQASGFGALTSRPIAVIIFSVVVNDADGVYSLTRDELAGIYTGRITNWSALRGPDLPIRIVSRGVDSGTRGTFDQTFLSRQGELPASSRDCVNPDPALPAAPVPRCEMSSTEEVLRQVNAIPGAIGYAEMATTSSGQPTMYPQLRQIQLGGYDASPQSVKNGGYPFWTVEYFYTFGTPDRNSTAAAFLDFLDSDAARSVMQQYGHIPCTDTDARRRALCTPRQ